MASGSHSSGYKDDMITLITSIIILGTKKKLRFTVRVRQSSCIGDFKYHLKASKDITVMQKKLFYAGKWLNDKMTLVEAGITENTIVEMESFRPPRRFTNNIAVKLPDGEVVNVRVHRSTTIEELKHKIQDEIGMPIEEQILELSGRRVEENKAVTEIYEETPIVVKCKLER